MKRLAAIFLCLLCPVDSWTQISFQRAPVEKEAVRDFLDTKAPMKARLEAADLLAKGASGKQELLAAIMPAFRDDDLRIIHRGASIVQAIGPRATWDLVQNLATADRQTGTGIALGLKRIGSLDPKTMRLLIRTTISSEFSVFYAALGALEQRTVQWIDHLPDVVEDAKELRKAGKLTDPGYLGGFMQKNSPRCREALFELLKDRSAEVRAIGLLLLGEQGLHTPEGIAPMITALRDEDASVRACACDMLALAEKNYKELVPVLTQLILRDRAAPVRSAALKALGRVRIDQDFTTPYKQREAVRMLLYKEIGVLCLPALQQAAADNDAEVRGAAAKAFGKFHALGTRSLTVILKLLEGDAEAKVRAAAIEALWSFETLEATIVPVLIRVLAEDMDIDVKKRAVDALSNHRKNQLALAALENALKSPHAGIRDEAIGSLGRMETRSTRILTLLIQACKEDSDATVRAAALFALPEALNVYLDPFLDGGAEFLVRGEKRRVMGALEAAMRQDKSLEVRRAAASVIESQFDRLGRAEDDYAWLIPSLVKTEAEKDPGLRIAALRILGRLQKSSAARTVLRRAFKDLDPVVREVAFRGLTPRSIDNLPDLIEALQDDHASVRRAAVLTMALLFKDERPGAPRMGAHLEPVPDKDRKLLMLEPGVGLVVSQVIAGSAAEKAALKAGDIIVTVQGEKVKNVWQVIRRVCLTATDQSLTFELFRDGKRLEKRVTPVMDGPSATAAISPLHRMLFDREDFARDCAADALSFVGGVPEPVFGDLLELLKDHAGRVREAAVVAVAVHGRWNLSRVFRSLSNHLQDSEDQVRETTAEVMGRLGSEAMAAVPALVQLLDDKNERVRGAAARALLVIAPDVVQGRADVGNLAAKAPQLRGDKMRQSLQHMLRASDYRRQKQDDLALEEYEKALQVLGKDDDSMTRSMCLSAAAEIHHNKGRFLKSEYLFREALELSYRRLNADPAETGRLLGSLAHICANTGRLPESLALAQQSIDHLVKNLGPDNVEVTRPQLTIAMVYQLRGAHTQAVTLLERALAIRTAKLPKNHPDTAEVRTHLATMYLLSGKPTAAEQLFRASLEEQAAASGGNDPPTAEILYRLGLLQNLRGQNEEAERTVKHALKIARAHPGADSLRMRVAALLGFTYLELDESLKAGVHLQEATMVLATGKLTDDDVAMFLQQYGLLYTSLGLDFLGNAAAELGQALSRRKMDPRHAFFAIVKKVQAEVALKRGEYAKAEALLAESLQALEAQFSSRHPEVAGILALQATLCAHRGRGDEALRLADRSRKLTHSYATSVLSALPEQEQLLFLYRRDERAFATLLSLAVDRKHEPTAVTASLEWVLNKRGVATELLAQRVLLAREHPDLEVRQLRDKLVTTREQLAYLTSSVATNARETAAKLWDEEQKFSRDLALRMGESAQSSGWTSIKDVQDRLRKGAALVEIVRAPLFTMKDGPKNIGGGKLPQPHYFAWVLTAAPSEPRLIDLGSVAAIDELLIEYGALAQESPPAVAAQAQAASEARLRRPLEKLSRLILEPLYEVLGPADRWLICPDGPLWFLPWSTLLLPDGRYAIEKHTISYLISGREAVREGRAASAKEPLVLADPDFDMNLPRSKGKKLLLPALDKTTPTPGLDLRKWNRLAGTAVEVRQLAPALERFAGRPPSIHTGDQARESMLKASPAPSVLVLSTHGFFLEEPKQTLPTVALQGRTFQFLGFAGPRPKKSSGVEGQAVRHPLLRCGLVLAGANRRERIGDDAAEDGIITGLEIINLDLRGTGLVVLSACETGLGKANNSEGVAGLRQAFHLAGAETVLSTLWKIPDSETADLMSSFFKNLAAGQGKSDALRHAQLEMIRQRRMRLTAAHPFYWAAFTLTGYER